MDKLLISVKKSLHFIGAAVTERPMPPVVVEGSRSYYHTTEHRVVLAVNAGPTTLAHELAHSQQADLSPAKYYSGGVVEVRAWMTDPRELEAMAVEVLAPLMAHEQWALCAAAIEGVGIVGVTRAKWASWLLNSSGNDAKPGYLPRSARRAMNAARLACQA